MNKSFDRPCIGDDVMKAAFDLMKINDDDAFRRFGTILHRVPGGFRFKMPGRGRNDDWSNKYKYALRCAIDAKDFTIARKEWMKDHPGQKIFNILKIA